MPWYKYKCECGQEFEVFNSIENYQSTYECPTCKELANRNPKDLVCGYKNDKDFFGKSK